MHAGVALLFVDSCEDGSAELGLKDRQQGMHAVSSGEQHASTLHEAFVRTLMFPSTPLDSRVCATTSVRWSAMLRQLELARWNLKVGWGRRS